MKDNHRPFIPFSLALAALIAVASGIGVFAPSLYDSDAFLWQVQSVWQDLTNLILVLPVLAISGLLASQGNKGAACVWAGTVLYVVYTYAIYCFSVHFNAMFLVYCSTLGVSVYALLWFAYLRSQGHGLYASLHRRPPAAVALYLIAIGVAFYAVWLKEIIPAIMHHTAPEEIVRLQLINSPVYVLDLSVILPLFVISGILLLKRKGIGLVLARLVLIFASLMSFSIGGLQSVMHSKHFESNVGLSILMYSLGVADIVFFMWITPLRSKSKAGAATAGNWNFG